MNYENEAKQSTPCWKVNLTEKFNQFCKTKSVKNQRNQVLSFEEELEQQLKSIPMQRQELSSNKKSRLFFRQNDESHPKSNKISDLKIQLKQNKDEQLHEKLNTNKSNLYERSEESQSQKLEKLRFDSSSKKQYSEEQQSFSLFTNKKVSKLFKDYFHQRESIELKEFIDMCCLEFFKRQSPTSQLKSILLDECRPIFCTTDENIISFNAVELLTKKTELEIIILEKFLYSKYKKKKRDLQKQYEQILVEILNQQENIRQENDRLTKRKKQIENKEKEIVKRQKTLKSQEKELLQKQKVLRKTLQEKNAKLTSEMTHLFESLTKALQKKSQALERNARNKLQLLEKRLNDFKQNSQYQNIPEKDSDDHASKKYQNQILLLKSKLRKTEKEFQAFFVEKSKEIKNLQTESNSLLKANTVLENKLEKSKTKCKELTDLITKQTIEFQDVKRKLQQKTQRIQSLENIVLELEHQTKGHAQQIVRPQKREKSQSRLQEKLLNQKQKDSFEANKKQVSTKENFEQLISKFNLLLGLILKGFEGDQRESTENQKAVKIEQILLKDAQSIISVCSDILWTSIEQNVKSIEHIAEFLLKLFMAKFSFLKFQSITSASSEQNSIEQFIQKIQTSFMQNHPQSTEIKLKLTSAFVLTFQTQASSYDFLNLNIFLTIIGFDEIYCQKKNKIQSIVTKLHSLVLKDIEKSQKGSKNSFEVIRKFEDEQTMTYMFWNYMSFSTSEEQSFAFIDILVELCNFYSLTLEPSQIPLFKTIFALENYRYIFNFLIINFTEKNLLNQNARQMFEKVSIVLQRFCYAFGQNISIEDTDLKRLRKIVRELDKSKEFEGSLFKANMQSIIDKICEGNE